MLASKMPEENFHKGIDNRPFKGLCKTQATQLRSHALNLTQWSNQAGMRVRACTTENQGACNFVCECTRNKRLPSRGRRQCASLVSCRTQASMHAIAGRSFILNHFLVLWGQPRRSPCPKHHVRSGVASWSWLGAGIGGGRVVLLSTAPLRRSGIWSMAVMTDLLLCGSTRRFSTVGRPAGTSPMVRHAYVRWRCWAQKRQGCFGGNGARHALIFRTLLRCMFLLGSLYASESTTALYQCDIHISMHTPMHTPMHMPIHMSIHLSLHLPIHLSVHTTGTCLYP